MSNKPAPTNQNKNSAEDTLLYEKLIYENLDKFYQLRLTVSRFRNIEYINVRKYFQSYEGDFIPSKEGVSMAASVSNITSLLEGLLEIISEEEGLTMLRELYSTHVLSNKNFDLPVNTSSGIIDP